jgi:hypothetical protein
MPLPVGTKTGLYTVCKFIVSACRVYERFAPAFLHALSLSTLSPSDQALITAAVSAMQAACTAAKLLIKQV